MSARQGRAPRAASLGLWAALGMTLTGCYQQPLPKAEPVTPLPAGEQSARSFTPASTQDEARQAIASKLALREQRMREAWEPGSTWAPLRIEQRDIDAGRISLPQLLTIGQQLFTLDFTPALGLGNGLAQRHSALAGPRTAPNLRHVQYKRFGGPDATRCVACHHLGGSGGGGFRIDNAMVDGDGEHPATALQRNPRALWGAAVLQQLAAEMTRELHERYLAAQRTLLPGQSVPLTAKGVSFGTLQRSQKGKLDGSGVRGVRLDLIVRPFGWKGTSATLRDVVIDSLQQNLGIQADELVEAAGVVGKDFVGDGPADDPDADGVKREATTGMVTALTAYLAALSLPIEESPEPQGFTMASSVGAVQFEQLGCATCHVVELPLLNPVVSLGPLPSSRPRVDLTPLLRTSGRSGRPAMVRLYSDLKMHDLGDELAEPRGYRGTPKHMWMTPPLWGLGASAPYLHDGRAGSIDAAIRAHGGEASAARDAYLKLSVFDTGGLRIFLQSLTRPAHLEFKP